MLKGCVPWPEEFAKRYRELGYWEGTTLFGMLERSAKRSPDKVAIIDGERSRTYRELVQRAEAIGSGLLQAGLRREDRVIFQLANSLELLETLFALFRIGVIPILALPAHRRAEISHFALASGAVAYLIPGATPKFDYREMAREVQQDVPDMRTVIVAGDPLPGQLSLAAVAESGADLPLTDAGPASEDVAMMLLSGGTTGRPKLIPRTHDDYLHGSTRAARFSCLDASTVYLAILPMAHNYTLGGPGIVGVLDAGGMVVVAGGNTDDIVFPTIERHRVTMVCAAVPLVAKWLTSDLFDKYDMSSLKIFMNGGAKLAAEQRRRIEETFRCTYQESFGTGEGLLNATRLDDPLHIRMESSGQPVSEGDEIKVINEEGNEVPEGEVGELVVRGPYTIRGYYNAPEANASAFTPDGFYRMGDVVRLVDGYIYLEGRRKDLINRGGEKISCEEIENHILAHPDIVSTCVVAMPDPVFGEKACAFIIPRDGAREPTLAELVKFLETRDFAKFKFPERLEVVDSFPISPAGKILRVVLRANIAEKIAKESAGAAA